MKSRTFFTKKKFAILIVIFILFGVLLSKFQINYIDFIGDLTYLDVESARISGLIYLKNINLLISNKEDFNKYILENNPEISKIDIYPKNSSTITIKITNKDVCCVVKDYNTNKFLISHEGKVLKKLSRDQNYPHEIFLNQELSLDSNLSLNSLKKIVEIENVLLDKEIEVTEIKLENDKILFKIKSGQYLIIDSETNTKNFVEKLSSMIDYLNLKNIKFSKMDFRFGNVIVE